MAHRGPDDEGFASWSNGKKEELSGPDTIDFFKNLVKIQQDTVSNTLLGHRRLSIIDTSEAGHQPMTDPYSGICMVYNGEVYNYKELRAELKALGVQFTSESDSEVVLKSFVQWKEKAFSKFNGMWAIAFYDSSSRTLTLSRDRFGIKPLYYSQTTDSISFASEVKVLRALRETPLTPNLGSINHYLKTSESYCSTETFWNEIQEVKPGCSLVIDDNGSTEVPYWITESTKPARNYNELIEEFGVLFEDSLKLRMRSDVEVGSLLSGGLDSTAIACNLKNLNLVSPGQFSTFSAVFNEEQFSERKYIEDTANLYQLKNSLVTPTPEELEEYLPKMMHHLEAPFRSLSVFSQFKIYESISSKSDVKVLLNGQGADELLNGYGYHYYSLLVQHLSNLKFADYRKEKQAFKENRPTSTLTYVKQMLYHTHQHIFKGNTFDNLSIREVSTSPLREYLHYDDTTSMAFGLEARVPFLDYRLVDFCLNLPSEAKIHRFKNKRILRDYNEGKITPSVLNRTDKMGFVSPQELWQKKELKLSFDNTFNDIMEHGLLKMNTSKLLKSYNKYSEGKFPKWNYIWRGYCLYHWAKENGFS